MFKETQFKKPEEMPIVKIGPKHQVTIPREIFDKLYLRTGDFLAARAQRGQIIMIPQQLTAKAPVPFLNQRQQKIISRIKEKINRIQINLINSKGLTEEEAQLAAKTGLIEPEQAWWWKEEWQKGEREAEKNIAKGKTSGPFKSVDELIEHLNNDN